MKSKKKFIILGVICFIVLLIVLLYKILFGGTGASVYGNRLDGIDKVKISNKVIENIKTDLGANEEVEKVTYKLTGKIVNVIITVKDDTSLDRSKEIASKVLEYFDDDQKAYYDFQIFLNSGNEESEIYPQLGYKHNTSDGFVWKQE